MPASSSIVAADFILRLILSDMPRSSDPCAIPQKEGTLNQIEVEHVGADGRKYCVGMRARFNQDAGFKMEVIIR